MDDDVLAECVWCSRWEPEQTAVAGICAPCWAGSSNSTSRLTLVPQPGHLSS